MLLHVTPRPSSSKESVPIEVDVTPRPNCSTHARWRQQQRALLKWHLDAMEEARTLGKEWDDLPFVLSSPAQPDYPPPYELYLRGGNSPTAGYFEKVDTWFKRVYG